MNLLDSQAHCANSYKDRQNEKQFNQNMLQVLVYAYAKHIIYIYMIGQHLSNMGSS